MPFYLQGILKENYVLFFVILDTDIFMVFQVHYAIQWYLALKNFLLSFYIIFHDERRHFLLSVFLNLTKEEFFLHHLIIFGITECIHDY